jgi:hypothetical protein
MEKHINEKINRYVQKFKDDLKTLLDNEQVDINESTTNVLKNYIDGYVRLQLKKEDFVKRKRVKNQVPDFDRCHAKRANGDRCSRRKQDNLNYCGTHTKGQPNGLIEHEDENHKKKIVVTLKQIQGIYCYIDDIGNVYDMKDIREGRENPRVKHKYTLSENGEYVIE